MEVEHSDRGIHDLASKSNNKHSLIILIMVIIFTGVLLLLLTLSYFWSTILRYQRALDAAHADTRYVLECTGYAERAATHTRLSPKPVAVTV